MDRAFIEALAIVRRDRNDFRAAEGRLSARPQFRTDVIGYRVHSVLLRDAVRGRRRSC